MAKFLDYMNKAAKPRPDEDVIDSANNRVTVFLFLAMGLSIFAKEYYGNPIKCWGRPEWTSSWLQYAEDYCFVEGTFFTKTNQTLPELNNFEKKGKKVNFYQWIPIIFHLMGLLMLLPRYFWTFMNWISYLHMNLILELTEKYTNTKIPFEPADIKSSVNHMMEAFKRKNRVFKKGKPKNLVKINNDNFREIIMNLWNYRYCHPSFLFIAYLNFKILNIIVVFVVMILLNKLIADEEGAVFGLDLLRSLIKGINWRETGYFARVTICTFLIRELGDESKGIVVPKTTQCVLSAQMIVEKFYIIVWYWLFFLQMANIYSFFHWIHLLTFKESRNYIKVILEDSMEINFPLIVHDRKYRFKKTKKLEEENRKKNEYYRLKAEGASKEEIDEAYNEYIKVFDDNSKEFIQWEKKRESNRRCYQEHLENNFDDFLQFIGKDGIFAIKMINNNTGYHVAGFIISKIFEKYICFIKTEQKAKLNNLEIEYLPSSPPKTDQTIVFLNDENPKFADV